MDYGEPYSGYMQVTFDTDLDRETDVSRFSISFFSAPTPHPLSQGYRLITQQTL